MASRVNVKFVVLLSTSVAAVFAMVAGVAIWVLSHTGPELEREGDQLMAAGLYEDASSPKSSSPPSRSRRSTTLASWRRVC